MTFWDRYNEKNQGFRATAIAATCSRLRSSLASRLAGSAASIRRIAANSVPCAMFLLCIVAVGLFAGA